MTLYCNIGDKPKVIYRASGDTKDKEYYAPIAPIDVNVIPFENPNLPNETYAWNFSTALNPRAGLSQLTFRAKGKLTDFKVGNLINTDTVNGQQIGNWAASFKDGNGNIISGSAVGYYPGDMPKLVKLLVPDPIKPPTDICQLQVKDINGKLLFTSSGKCPITYKVICGNCAEGEQECKTNKYPGYCCIPCQKTATRINNLAAKVRAK